MSLATTREELQEILSSHEFTRLYDFRVHSIDDGECTIEIPFNPKFVRPGGVISGPVYMAAADCAAWLAIMTKLGAKGAEMAVTVELKTNFLSGAREENVLCKAKVLKMGRRIIYCVAECTSLEGKLFTHHTVTYINPESSRHPHEAQEI